MIFGLQCPEIEMKGVTSVGYFFVIQNKHNHKFMKVSIQVNVIGLKFDCHSPFIT